LCIAVREAVQRQVDHVFHQGQKMAMKVDGSADTDIEPLKP